ncbi:hypothetical protein H9P43_004136 [Blastocladiella emersonii ATCC 22665]|nr:hypothetical protein H9P43_004136 [Blastocladiella emersonii ATCC 22665]
MKFGAAPLILAIAALLIVSVKGEAIGLFSDPEGTTAKSNERRAPCELDSNWDSAGCGIDIGQTIEIVIPPPVLPPLPPRNY